MPIVNISQLTYNFSADVWEYFGMVVLSRVGISFLFPIVQNVCVVLNACGSNGKGILSHYGGYIVVGHILQSEKLGTDGAVGLHRPNWIVTELGFESPEPGSTFFSLKFLLK